MTAHTRCAVPEGDGSSQSMTSAPTRPTTPSCHRAGAAQGGRAGSGRVRPRRSPRRRSPPARRVWNRSPPRTAVPDATPIVAVRHSTVRSRSRGCLLAELIDSLYRRPTEEPAQAEECIRHPLMRGWQVIEEVSVGAEDYILLRRMQPTKVAGTGLDSLTPREREALHHASAGASNKEIAHQMEVSAPRSACCSGEPLVSSPRSIAKTCYGVSLIADRASSSRARTDRATTDRASRMVFTQRGINANSLRVAPSLGVHGTSRERRQT